MQKCSPGRQFKEWPLQQMGPDRGGQSCTLYSSAFSLGLLASAFPHRLCPCVCGGEGGSLVPACACGAGGQCQVLLCHSVLFICYCFLYLLCLHAHHLCVVPCPGSQSCWIPWNWNYGCDLPCGTGEPYEFLFLFFR